MVVQKYFNIFINHPLRTRYNIIKLLSAFGTILYYCIPVTSYTAKLRHLCTRKGLYEANISTFPLINHGYLVKGHG